MLLLAALVSLAVDAGQLLVGLPGHGAVYHLQAGLKGWLAEGRATSVCRGC